VIQDRKWDSIDKVYHRGSDGELHYYSSKPPLLSVALAGEYWLIKKLANIEISKRPFYVGRLILIATNVSLLLALFWATIATVERFGKSDFSKFAVVATVTFGTFLTTFAVTINNHLPAAACASIALFCGLRIWIDDCKNVRYFFGAGFFAAMCAVNDLPAFSFFALLGLALLWKQPSRTLLAGMPGAVIVLAAALGTNWIAHGTLKPAYMHRTDGPLLGIIDRKNHGDLDQRQVPAELATFINEETEFSSGGLEVRVREANQSWVAVNDENIRLALRRANGQIEVRRWGNWYEYPSSYWQEGVKTGVDLGEECRGWYLFHFTLGHYGVFSLTPIWLLSVVGIVVWTMQGGNWRHVAIFILLITVVCMTFYVLRPLEDRNYGGVTSGFRWTFWLIPLWLACLIPICDRWSRSIWGQRMVALLLLFSAVSASYSAMNPWVHPWIYTYLQYLDWL